MTYNYSKYCAHIEHNNSCLSTNARLFRQKINAIGAIDLTDKKFWTSKNEDFLKRTISYNIHLFPDDIDYINEKICHHVAFDLPIENNFLGILGFYENILQDENAPNSIKKIVSIIIADTIGSAKCVLSEKEISSMNYRHQYINLWYEMLNLTRQKI